MASYFGAPANRLTATLTANNEVIMRQLRGWTVYNRIKTHITEVPKNNFACT